MTAQEIVAEINQTVKGFQKTNDERFAELKAALDQNAKDTARAMLGSDGPVPTGDAARLEKFAKEFMSAALHRPARAGEMDKEVLNNYSAGFPSLLRFGESALPPEIAASMRIGSDGDGGHLAPAEMAAEIYRRGDDLSSMRPISTVIQVSGPSYEQPVQKARGISGGWVGETQSRTATATGEMALLRIPTHEQYAFPQITQNLLDDASYPVEEFLISSTVDELTRTENVSFISGDGVQQPTGILKYAAASVTTEDDTRPWGVLQYVPTGASGGFPKISGSTADDADCLWTLISKLPAPYRSEARFAMNRTSASIVRRLKDASGRYLWVDGLVEGQPDRLCGFPVSLVEGFPDFASDAFPIAFGNFRRGYLICDRIGIRVLRDPFTNRPYVGMYITRRVGADVRDFLAIRLLKASAS